MSLILGIYSKNGNIDKKEVKEVIDNFSFDGKRDIDVLTDKRIILAKSKYQTSNIVESEKSVILLSGEVHGEDICKDSCAEFILKSYQEYGASSLKKVNGIFAFVIYNREKDELILGNDSFGLHPLFIYNSEDYVIFSSEYEPIIKYKKFNKELDYDSISEYFVLGLPLGDKTFFKEINNLHPGSVLTIKDNKTCLKQYEKLDIKVDKNKSITQFAKEVSKCINKAVQIRVKEKKNLASPLTSGADTRLILSNLTKAQRKNIKFYTDKSPYLAEDEDQDIKIAKIIARKLNLNYKVNKEFTNKTDNFDEFGASFFDNTRLIPKSNKKLLAGTFGGEFLGGFCLKLCPIKLKKVKKNEAKQEIRSFNERIERKSVRLFSDKIVGKMSNPYDSLNKEIKNIKSENKGLLFAINQFTRGFFTNIYGGTRAGRWFSPHIMHLGSQFIYPFLDTEFLKLLLTIPEEFLLDYNLYNQVYKENFNELVSIPTNSSLALRKDSCMKFADNATDPKSVRRYSGYSEVLKEYLNSKDTWGKDFFNNELIKLQSKIRPNNYSPNDKQTKLISSFIDFETWYRKFVK